MAVGDVFERHLRDLMERLYHEAAARLNKTLPAHLRVTYDPQALWDRLAGEGRWDVITTLRHVEEETPGYGTVVVPELGFSEDDVTHNMVVDYLMVHGVLPLNPGLLISRMREDAHQWHRRSSTRQAGLRRCAYECQ